MPKGTVSTKQATDMDLLAITSIQANAHSLMEQLKDYDFLIVTSEQSQRLSKIEKQFHELVQDITNRTR